MQNNLAKSALQNALQTTSKMIKNSEERTRATESQQQELCPMAFTEHMETETRQVYTKRKNFTARNEIYKLIERVMKKPWMDRQKGMLIYSSRH